MPKLIQLKHGLSFGRGSDAEIQYDLEIRELTTGDLIDSEVASEKAVPTPNGVALVSSPALMGFELLRRSVLRIGKINGPLSMGQLRELHPEDLQELQLRSQFLQNLTISCEVGDSGR